MKIRSEAGKLRGVRVMADPEGILLDPFLDMDGITTFGYLLIPHEGSPAVYDGRDWHPVYDGDDLDLHDLAAKQYADIKTAIENGNSSYAQLAALLQSA
jgi:hypothetical protein